MATIGVRELRQNASQYLDRVRAGETIEVSVRGRVVARRAGTLASGQRLRTLDAIHVATASVAGDRLEALVTYDMRMAQAAASIALPVERP